MTSKQRSKKTSRIQLTSIPLMQLMTGFWASKTLAAAMDLDLFSHLAGRGVTAEDLSQSLKLELRPAEMLLSACAALGLLDLILPELNKPGGRLLVPEALALVRSLPDASALPEERQRLESILRSLAL